MNVQVCDPITKIPQPIPLSGVNHHGHSFQMVIITRGKVFGRDLCVVHDGDEPLVAFHDTTKHQEFFNGVDGYGYGQFTGGRYCLHTIMNDRLRLSGLDLNGHVDEWKLTPAQMSEALDILESRFPQE